MAHLVGHPPHHVFHPPMPVVSDASTSKLNHQLERRKGGGGGRGGGGGGGKKGGGKISGSRGGTSVSGLNGRTTSAGSRGGGAITTVPSGSRFAGRQAGSGTRDNVYGGTYYGSGYPYGSYGSSWVAGRPFPFYYWPVYIGPHEYYGSSEYGPANSTDRPGGPMMTISVYTGDPKYNTSDVYRILGDYLSVQTVIKALNSNCSVAGGTIWSYDPSSDDLAHSLPRAENIIQYYRASSFALALDGYNNSVALASASPVNNATVKLVDSLAAAAPLPSTINRAFLDCVNTTVATSLPLVDAGLSNLPPVNGLGMLCLLWATFMMIQRALL